MQELHSDDSEELFIASVDEGMLSEDYDLVGIQDSGPGEDSRTDCELFIVSVGTEV